jgi:hypothetical protein
MGETRSAKGLIRVGELQKKPRMNTQDELTVISFVMIRVYSRFTF